MSLKTEPPILDRVGIKIGGKRYEFWTSYRITTDIFSPVDEFSLRCGPLPEDLFTRLLPGQRYEVYVGNDDGEDFVLQSGWTQSLEDSGSKNDEGVDITGRDYASDLTENTVPFDLDPKDRKFFDMAQDICSPFGVTVLCSNEVNRLAVVNRKKWKRLMAQWGHDYLQYHNHLAHNVAWEVAPGAYKKSLELAGIKKPIRPPQVKGIFKRLSDAAPQDGESCWEFLARYAERLEVWMWMTATGELVIQRPRYDQEPSYTFVDDETDPTRNNVLSARRSYGIAGIPTKTSRIGRTIKVDGKKTRLTSETSSSAIIPTAEDVIVPTTTIRVDPDYRREIWSEDKQARDADQLDRRTFYSQQSADGRVIQLELDVDGHDQGGRPFVPDTVCRYKCDRRSIDRLFYVASVEYTQGVRTALGDGKQSHIRCTPLNAWNPES